MAALVVIVGPSGAGKTSLLRSLEARGGFAVAVEEHAARPYQALFKQDHRFALPNQLDYLLLRAHQEQSLRSGTLPGLMDGGLDQDFHGFTRLFHFHGWLDDADFDLCSRYYQFIRSLLPPPERVIALHAAPEAIRLRLAQRDRINIASDADADRLDAYIKEWLASRDPADTLHLDVSHETQDYSRSCSAIIKWLKEERPHR